MFLENSAKVLKLKSLILQVIRHFKLQSVSSHITNAVKMPGNSYEQMTFATKAKQNLFGPVSWV